MAQTGYTPIQLYYSSTASAAPNSANLIPGELALNTTDGKLFFKNSSGVVTLLANSTSAGGNLPGGTAGAIAYQSAPNITTFLPVGPSNFVLTSNGTLPVYTNPATISVGSATTAGTATNLAGGAANRLVFQASSGTTAFAPAPTTAGLVLGWTGTVFNWVSAPAATSATNLAGGAAFQVPYQSAPNTTQFSNNFQFDGTYLRVGDTTPLTGATNPTFAATGSANQYVQSYIYNANPGASASADFVAYTDLSTDTNGWGDFGYTSSGYADPTYSVTGPNEAYVFASAPVGSTATGNMVYATDSTGVERAHQWYVGGFNQAKNAWKMQLTSSGLELANALAPNYGGTGLTTPGASGNVLQSNGSSWVSAPFTSGPSTAKVYYMAQF